MSFTQKIYDGYRTSAIASFRSRQNDIINLLSFLFPNSPSSQVTLLILFHYGILFSLGMYAVFGKVHSLMFGLSFMILIGQLYVNVLDNGCYIMKTERKYLGKQWIGPYGMIRTVYPSITDEEVGYLFWIIAISLAAFVLFRIIVSDKHT